MTSPSSRGARLEQTDLDGWGHQVADAGRHSHARHARHDEEQIHGLLPSLNAIYSLGPQLQLRAAITKTIARPNPQDILPVRTINDTTLVITDGNPDLRVTESINYDVGDRILPEATWPPLRESCSKKRSRAFMPTKRRPCRPGNSAAISSRIPAWGPAVGSKGLELEVQKRLTFLPGWLRGLGVGANHTWLDAEGTYANRPGVKLPFNGTAEAQLERERVLRPRPDRSPGVRELPQPVSHRRRRAHGARCLRGQPPDGELLRQIRREPERLTLNLDVNNITDSPKRGYSGRFVESDVGALLTTGR